MALGILGLRHDAPLNVQKTAAGLEHANQGRRHAQPRKSPLNFPRPKLLDLQPVRAALAKTPAITAPSGSPISIKPTGSKSRFPVAASKRRHSR